jgi:hypothetical protein
LSGKLYYEQKDFVKSLEQFQKLTWARGIDRYVKLDSRYYIALSQLETNEPSKAWQTIKKLIADEDRVDKANLYNVLKGRILFAQNKDDKANELLEGIVKNSPRTLFSAEACYWLAEYHYRKQHDISKAVESYNKVKTEAALSPFANDAGSKAAALGLIITGASMQPDDNPQAYVDNRLAVAENFFMVFALPDSVLHVFTQLDSIPQFIQHKADSLTVRLDSLNIARLALAEYAQTDSMQADSSSVKQHADSLQSEILLPKPPIDTMPDSLSAEPDTLKLTNNVISDSLELHISTAADSLVQFQQAAKIRYSTLGQEISAIETELKAIAVTQTAYQEQFLPYAMFVEASMVKRGLADSTMIADIYRDMLNRFPVNKYTNALRMLIEGEQVRLVDPALDVIESQMDTALANIESTPDSAVVSLTELSHSSYPQIAIKANFRLGWYYTFETPDTLVAKPYFDEVLKLDRTGDYGSLVTRFYTGTKYSFPKLDFGTFDSLLVRIKRADSLAAVRADSLAAAKADSIAASDMGKHHKKEKDKQPTEVDDLPETLSPDSQPVLKEEEHLLPEPKPSR